MKNVGLLVAGLLLSVCGRGQSLAEAIAMTNGERFAAAGTAFRALLAANPKDGETWFHYGENYFYNDKLDSAQVCYQRGVDADPRHPLCYVGLGKVLWNRGIPVDAQARFAEAIAVSINKVNKFPKKLQAQTLREVAEGMGFGPHKDTGKALEHIERALVLDPDDPETYILKGDVQLESNPSDATGPLVNYKHAIDLQPSSARAVAKKALMYHRAVNYTAAIAEYTKAIGLDAAFAPAYSGRAESFFMDRQYDLATADYNTYLELNKGDRSARIRYAKFLFLSKKYDEALAEINSLRTTGETDATLKRLQGYAYVEKGEFEMAKNAMDDYFVEQDPAKVIASDFEYMAKAYAGLAGVSQPGPTTANYDSLACEMCVKGAMLDRSKDYLYIEAVKLFVKTKKYDKAVEAMRSKIANGKPETNDYYYLGDAALKGKLWMTADSAWATYIERNPKAYQGYKYRARAQVGLDPDKITWGARPYFEEMLRRMKPEEMAKSPADVEEAYFYLGFYNFYSTKDMGTAKCWFEKVKAVNAGTANTKIAMDMLLTKELKDVTPVSCGIPANGSNIENSARSARTPLDGGIPANGSNIENSSGSSSVINLRKSAGGVWLLEVGVNGLTLKDVVFDTGATTVLLSATEALFLLKQGYIKEDDFAEKKTFMTADGKISEGVVLNIRELRLGVVTLKNVPASVTYSLDSPILLGQSALMRFQKFQFDNVMGQLILE